MKSAESQVMGGWETLVKDFMVRDMPDLLVCTVGHLYVIVTYISGWTFRVSTIQTWQIVRLQLDLNIMYYVFQNITWCFVNTHNFIYLCMN